MGSFGYKEDRTQEGKALPSDMPERCSAVNRGHDHELHLTSTQLALILIALAGSEALFTYNRQNYELTPVPDYGPSTSMPSTQSGFHSLQTLSLPMTISQPHTAVMM